MWWIWMRMHAWINGNASEKLSKIHWIPPEIAGTWLMNKRFFFSQLSNYFISFWMNVKSKKRYLKHNISTSFEWFLIKVQKFLSIVIYLIKNVRSRQFVSTALNSNWILLNCIKVQTKWNNSAQIDSLQLRGSEMELNFSVLKNCFVVFGLSLLLTYYLITFKLNEINKPLPWYALMFATFWIYELRSQSVRSFRAICLCWLWINLCDLWIRNYRCL